MACSLRLVVVLEALVAGVSAAAAPASPTFATDIAPLVYQRCAPCHHAGEPTPFALTTYQDVRTHGRDIARATASHHMPPWLPEPGYGDFSGSLRLSDAQIKLISDWVRAGMPEGDVRSEPPSPVFSDGWQLGQPDLVLRAAKPFLSPATGPDVYWNFVLKPDVTTTRYVRAIEIRPGPASKIHHANLLVDRAASTARYLTAGGFPGMDVTLRRSVFDPDGHFLFWKPGSIVQPEPDGFAWRLDPGNLLVLNTHIQTTGKRESIAPGVGLYFTNVPQSRFPMILELEDDNDLNIPPNDSAFRISDHFRLPIDVDVLAIYPHAHYLGKVLEAYAVLPDGTRKWLIRISDWDPACQAVYRYRKPDFLPAGSVIWMRYTYDNSARNPNNPNSPPKRVMAGNSSTDEMGHLWLEVLPKGMGDHRRELEEALLQHRLDKDPVDPVTHMNLGVVLLSRLQPQQAVTQFEEAVRLDAGSGEAHDLLGAGLRATGRLQEAIAQFRQAVKLDDTDLNARRNLAMALAQTGDYRDAVQQFAKVAAAYPNIDAVQREYAKLQAAARGQ